eukprot:GHVO01059396.1.p1 GENE.GHVO01059396.1~~GHVO01059396.1.p1  ORF type:complete len:114 (-),score=0.96 GHVO01059396.1:461-802(-)
MLELKGIDTTRRSTAHAKMTFQQAVLNRGPRSTRTLFSALLSDPRSHLKRISTSTHPHQLIIKRKRSDLKNVHQFCASFVTFNQINELCFPSSTSLTQYERSLVDQFSSGDSL